MPADAGVRRYPLSLSTPASVPSRRGIEYCDSVPAPTYMIVEPVTIDMDQNVGSTDKKLRTLVGAVAGVVSLAILAGPVPLPTILSPVLGVVAIMMLGTALTGTCGLYSLLGVDTCSRSGRGSL